MLQMIKCVGMVVLFLAPVVGHGSCNTVGSACTDANSATGTCRQPYKGETNCVTVCSAGLLGKDCFDVYGGSGTCTRINEKYTCVTAP